jgi:apolipoprotein N-acyltransferase
VLRLVRDDQAGERVEPSGVSVPARADGHDSASRTVTWWQAIGAGLVHGALMAGAFPPVGLWGLALLAPLPLAWLISRPSARPGRMGLLAAAGVLPFWMLEQVWVTGVSAFGYVPMCLYLSMFTWLLVWAGGRIRRRLPGAPMAIVLPVVWVGVDVLRGMVAFDGYPWYFVAHPLIDAPRLAWPASFLGVYAVTFLVVAVAGAILDLRRTPGGRPRAGMVTIGAVAILVVAGGAWTAPAVRGSGPLVRVAVVQTNIPQDNKMGWSLERRLADWARFEALARLGASAVPPPDLVVLPETMFPGWTLDAESLRTEREAALSWTAIDPPVPTTHFADRLLALQAELGVPVVIGALGHDGFRLDRDPEGGVELVFAARYNSAVAIDGGQVQPVRYDKRVLTPFGEVMPYISLWPWLQNQMLAWGAHGMSFDLSAGASPTVIEVRGPAGQPIRMATPICFEATMPGACRELVFDGGVRRADLLLNLTNDGWFGHWDAGRRQHLQLARWRCLELGTPMVRAANTGISALIDPWGRVLRLGVDGSTNPSRADGVLVVDVPRPVGTTVYARVGDAAAVGIAIAAAGMLMASVIPYGRNGGPGADTLGRKAAEDRPARRNGR